jgi:hypothetical protein
MEAWLRWLEQRVAPQQGPDAAALQRVADLEAALVEARRAAGLAPTEGHHAQHQQH